ncbi:hypothetical protein SUGI_0103780 [Cryptomeria japonica]|uniref:NAC domain-containing protein 79 n=1 Tax=Cryptomeria japonica TaxID=3369 RepID=UPI0024089797|nr:NAC domain-containing protein 79 [Cryptomeria japonica]GLJ09205.1 hypothetical protein SUGI_0103780 [Cryptomeria japonica]
MESLNVMSSSSNNNNNNNNMQVEEKSEDLPPGFRFHPTDEELVTYYLTKKILDGSFSGRAITEVDLNKCEPWDLPGKAKMGEKEWYFFSLRDRKYPTGLRTNRATEAGYWKTTGKDREIFNSRTSALVGMKKTLVFYKGRAPKGEKTNWVMHEYRLEGKFSYHRLPKNCKDEWVVCRIFQKNAGGKKMSTIGLMNRNPYLDMPGSPSLPSLLESPYNATNAMNDQGTPTGSIENETGTSAKADHVSCFSSAMDYNINNNNSLYNFMGHPQLQQPGTNNSDPCSSDHLSEMTKFIKLNMMLNDSRMNMNVNNMNALSNLRRDPSMIMPHTHLPFPLPPPLMFNPQIPLSSSPYNSSFNLPPHPNPSTMLRTLFTGQSSLLMDPSPSTFGALHDKTLDKTTNSNPIQWVNDTDQQPGNDQQADCAAQCLSTDHLNEDIQLNRSFDQVDQSSAAAPPVDIESFWSFRDHDSF